VPALVPAASTTVEATWTSDDDMTFGPSVANLHGGDRRAENHLRAESAGGLYQCVGGVYRIDASIGRAVNGPLGRISNIGLQCLDLIASHPGLVWPWPGGGA
jgi:hypothetical protein